jgi:ferredoxin
MLLNILFLFLFLFAVILFVYNVRQIAINIRSGVKTTTEKNMPARLKALFLVAIGQSKMVKRPVAGILHLLIYVGFVIVNIELLEILFDGITGSHRALSILPFYPLLISALEILAVLVILACLVFLFRRNVLKLKRFEAAEMKSWPRMDANIILIAEILLMAAFILMNTADLQLQALDIEMYKETGYFLVSSFLMPAFQDFSANTLTILERSAWWFHIIGIFAFLNYIPFSKHFHILLSFPNVYYSKLKPLTYIANMDAITKEVRIAMGLQKEEPGAPGFSGTFGACDIGGLSRKMLMEAYSCTECGRCTSVCPAHLTGKKLSPRKIVMDTRDRLEEFGRNNKRGITNNRTLLKDYISEEEIWACTTCNACSNECPLNIDPVSIIIELRRYLFMEKSAAPSTINAMSSNIENNGAPWQYPAADRDNWAKQL